VEQSPLKGSVMRPRHVSHVLLLAAFLATTASCGHNDGPADRLLQASSPAIQLIDPPRYLDEASNPPPRSTPEELFANYFEQVYVRRDSVLYAAMLDRRFEFAFLPWDVDSLGMDTWTKRFDLRSTGAMFRDPRVVGITLNIQIDANYPYFASDCENCRLMETTITLRVTMDDGSGEPFVFAVDSPQAFIVRPDAIQVGKWSVFRQIDRPAEAARVGDGEPAPRVESFSWGRVKGFFFQ
jgi:hypothetical protein